MEEIWKDIKGYEGFYQVSDWGRVKSLDRVIIDVLGRKQYRKSMFLKPAKSSSGHFMVFLQKNGKGKSIGVHVLVAVAFLNHKPCGHKVTVDHIKEKDKLNNRLDNLQLITQRENTSKYYRSIKTTSKYMGVSWSKSNKKWIAQINIKGKVNYLGSFTKETNAAKAYIDALATSVKIAKNDSFISL